MEYGNLQEWLNARGNPKHATAEGDNGAMVLIVDNSKTLNPGITIYNYRESVLPNGETSLWMNSGWGVRREYLPALKKYLGLEDE
jgi:hypothetical protein